MVKLFQGKEIPLGICYYPEHWDKKLWADDLRRMKETGISVIRIGDYAWSVYERTEGVFTFDLFDEFLALASKEGMCIIMCTSSVAPPAWLSEKYPEILNARRDGVLFRHGNRRHYNYNSPVYREFVGRLVEKIASRYGKNPAVIGWQIDNELNCQTDEFYSESDTIAFRAFLKEKYLTLDALNEAWGTVVWNQTYTEWEQVFVPRTHVSPAPNPHLLLDYIRFVSESVCGYVKLQRDILRQYIKEGDFITTNGMYASIDHHRLVRENLDFYTIVSYPNGVFTLNNDTKNSMDLNDRKASRTLAELRSISPAFGIMEQQAGAGGWNIDVPSSQPKPGQMTLWTIESIAHGADYVGFFRWRTANKGTEIYWHGVLDYANKDNRRLAELRDIGGKIKVLSPVKGSQYEAAFGVIKDYDNIFDSQVDKWHERLSSESEDGLFQAAQLSHTPMDYVYLTEITKLEDLSKYPVLFYPHPAILTEDRVKLLTEYVKTGGILVFGARTGYKDTNGRCPMTELPGLVGEFAGVTVVDSTFVGPQDETVKIRWGDSEFDSGVFNDFFEPRGRSNILGTYENNYYAGTAALVCNPVGKGSVYCFGGTFNREAALVFLKKLEIEDPYRNILNLPEGCELAVRKGGDKRYLFVLNFMGQKAALTLKKELRNLYTGEKAIGEIELPPFGTMVFEEG
ncbi:beta-galactosidase [Treponema sp. TIM-1]|uniref:beta-galactosidase n=1 Tax=Treponema sp. TIM-1 TaxID=2898417 RepID=UPI003980C3FE